MSPFCLGTSATYLPALDPSRPEKTFIHPDDTEHRGLNMGIVPCRLRRRARDFFKRFPDDEACLEHIFNARPGERNVCRVCCVSISAEAVS